jgi:hypothetical protein
MTPFHPALAAGRWRTLTLVEQLANVGSDVGRALNWRQKGDHVQSEAAIERALELMDFTLDDPKHQGRTRELARLRESLVDFFYGSNEFGSTEESIRNYFDAFALAARRNR